MSEQQMNLFEIGSPKRSTKSKIQRHYEWQIGSAPPVLGKHSIAKHAILTQYLKKYVEILTVKKVQEQLRLTLVDGFAGGGLYLHPDTNDTMPGSPIIMVESMQEAEKYAKQNRRKEFNLDVEYFFIEERKETQDFLKKQLAECESAFRQKERIEVIGGDFSVHLDKILDRVEQRGRSRRVIFVLDQYGFTDVSMFDLRKIFSRLPNAEVILTIATDWLVDYWSESNFQLTLPTLGLDLTADFADRIKQEHPADWRPIVQYALHTEFKRQSGAGYYTPFFIHSTESHRAYWLLHFSGHAKARDVMTQLHWELENHFQHFGLPGFNMLGYDPKRVNDIFQPTLDYQFDASAKKLTFEALNEQIPRIVDVHGIAFNTFFDRIVNETPATKAMIESSVRFLNEIGEIEVLSADGNLRQPGVKLKKGDLIRRSKQLLFFSANTRDSSLHLQY